MALALEMAEQAAMAGEVPVGAVLVKDQQLIAKAHNQSIQHHDPSAHAEIQVLRQAGSLLNNYRLIGTQLYVTLEPCIMCAGAIIQARVDALIYGTSDPKTGAAGSVYQILEDNQLNHQTSVLGGIMLNECQHILKQFFQARRQNQKKI